MKNKAIKTKLLTALLTLCMVLSLAPISAFAVDSTVSNETELTAALENADCAEIKLGGSIETTWELDVGRTVTLDLNGYTLSCSGTDEDIIRVRSSGSLTIKDSSTGGKIDGQNKNCGIEVKGGTLTLESGSIVNCTDADGDGGAVDVSNTGVTETQVKYGKFIMNGGAIMDCKAGDDGGAVDIGSGCTFIMNGGTISSCRADDDGGAVFIKQSGSFELNSGVIQNCSAGANGGAVNIYQDGRFTMTGGTIKSCKVDLGGLGMAVYGSNDKAVVTMTGGTFEDCGAYPYSFDEFTVTFDSDGGSAVTAQKVLNSPAIKPADPTKNGYLFAGWYLEDMQYAFDTTVTTDITLKAHWTPTSASTAISAATIENAKFDYQPGDAPRATAEVPNYDTDKYEIAYECWQEFENNEPVAAWYSDDGIYSTLPTITAFESGKKYVYSILLLPERGYDFAREVAATVNGSTVTAVPGTDGYLSLPNVKTITPTAASHTHSYGTAWKYDDTNHWHECACGDKADIAAHSASEWIVDTAATETADGAKHKECTVCKKVLETAPIPATGSTHTHSYGTDWKYDGTNHWHECECGDKADTAAHSFQWVIDKAATKEATGIKHEECTVCGAKRSENTVIDKLPDGGNTGNTGSGDNNTDKPGKDDSTKSPQTGDSSNLIGWLAALFVSGGVLGVLGVTSKKKEEKMP